jgi:hypothetical protein
LVVAKTIVAKLKELDLSYPELSADDREEMLGLREQIVTSVKSAD